MVLVLVCLLNLKLDDIKKSKNYFNADCIEIHTGKICNLINKKKDYKAELC